MPLLLILFKVTLLLVAALGISVVMQRASAGSRHLVWLVALGALLLLPLLATWGPIHLRALPGVLDVRAPSLAFAPANAAGAAVQSPGPVLPGTIGAAAPHRSIAAAAPHVTLGQLVSEHLGTTLLVAWLAVALTLLCWLAYGTWSVGRIIRRAARLDHPDWQQPLYEIADRLGLAAAPQLLRSNDVKMPFACGLMRCTIVLPAECDDWSTERRSAVLIHELGHVRRRDLVGHTLGRFACALYWFHPMVWTAARRLRAESERACDDLALRFGARPSDYAEHLLDIVTCVRDHATPSVALALAHRKEFEGRMLAILNPELRRTAFSRLQTASLVGALALVAVIVSAAAPVPTQSPAPRAPVAGPSPIVGGSSTVLLKHGDAGDQGAPLSKEGKGHTQVKTNSRIDVRIDTRLTTALRLAHRQLDVGAPAGDSTARIALLVQLLRGDTAANVRRIAAWGLNQYDDDGAVRRALAAAVANDRDDGVREMAAWALGQTDDGGNAELAEAARSDRSDDVREVAVWALANRGAREPAVLDALTAALHDRAAAVRGTAAWGMGQFHLEAVPKRLLDALSDSNADVRLKAAWATSEIGDSTALPFIRAALRRETTTEVERVQLRALIRSGEAPEKMVEWLRSKDAGVREMAVRAVAGDGASQPWPWPWPRPRPQP